MQSPPPRYALLRSWSLVVFSLPLSCATSGRDDSQLTIGELSNKTSQQAVVGFSKFSGISDYTFKELPLKVEWLACKPTTVPEKGTVVVMHRDKAGYDPAKFCAGWIAQTLLANGLAVAAVNRPGFGNSNGRADFNGGKSMAAIAKGVESALGSMAAKNPPSGIWGYSSGATAALFASKSIKGLSWAIVGGGIFDLEDTSKKSNDSYIKKEIEDVRDLEGNKGIEDRSISYDVSGLPKRLIVYHGKDDQTVPISQAVSFEETLNTSEYQATMQVIEGVPHDIPANLHRQVLDVLLHSVVQ